MIKETWPIPRYGIPIRTFMTVCFDWLRNLFGTVLILALIIFFTLLIKALIEIPRPLVKIIKDPITMTNEVGHNMIMNYDHLLKKFLRFWSGPPADSMRGLPSVETEVHGLRS